jgi:arginyl-tRNA synthetase
VRPPWAPRSCALLDHAGYVSGSEFYVNDAGNQVELLGASLAARFAEQIGQSMPMPENGYRGEYVRALAAQLPEAEARPALAAPDGGAGSATRRWRACRVAARRPRRLRRDVRSLVPRELAPPGRGGAARSALERAA